MKKTLIDKLYDDTPSEIFDFINGADIYDSSSSPEARVCFIDKDCGYYLKSSDKGTLKTEYLMTRYFNQKKLGAEVVSYISNEKDWLLTKRAVGEDAANERFLSEPKKLCDSLAQYLRELHETDFSGSPIKNRNETYLALAHANYKNRHSDLSLTEELFPFKSADEAYKILCDGISHLKCDVLLHGDYCLPNVILNDDFTLSGFIDLGNAGVGDRHIDLFWGTWTLFFNLKTDKYRTRFFDAYGRDKVDEEIIRTIAAAEVFG